MANFFFSFFHCQIIWYRVIELLGNYIFKLGDCFFFESWQMATWNFFFDFEPCRPNYTSKKVMQQWGSYCLQWSLGPEWSVWATYNTVASLPCSNDYSSTLCKQSPCQDHYVPLQLSPNINWYHLLNILLHNRRQFSVEVLINNSILVNVSVSLLTAKLSRTL